MPQTAQQDATFIEESELERTSTSGSLELEASSAGTASSHSSDSGEDNIIHPKTYFPHVAAIINALEQYKAGSISLCGDQELFKFNKEIADALIVRLTQAKEKLDCVDLRKILDEAREKITNKREECNETKSFLTRSGAGRLEKLLSAEISRIDYLRPRVSLWTEKLDILLAPPKDSRYREWRPPVHIRYRASVRTCDLPTAYAEIMHLYSQLNGKDVSTPLQMESVKILLNQICKAFEKRQTTQADTKKIFDKMQEDFLPALKF